MKKRRLVGFQAVVTTVAAAVLAVPFFAFAGEGATGKSPDASAFKLMRHVPGIHGGNATDVEVSSTASSSTGLSFEAALGGVSLFEASSDSDAFLNRRGASAASPDGLRALGDTDIVLFNAMDPAFLARFTGGEQQNFAQFIAPGDVGAAAGKAYAVEQVSFPFVRISNPAKHTYAKISIGPASASLLDGSCNPNVTPIMSKTYNVIVDLGAPTNTTCDTDFASGVATDDFDSWAINLLTGDATSTLTGAVTPGVIVFSDVPAGAGGAIPMGDGTRLWVFAMYLGELNGAGDDVVNGPFGDACVAKVGASGPGGMIWMNWNYGDNCAAVTPLSDFVVDSEGTPGAGRAVTGVFMDGTWTGAGDGDRIPECGEGWFCGQTLPGIHMNARLEGATGADCNGNGIVDGIDIAGATSTDANANSIPDDCELIDCDSNGIPDMCDFDCANIVPAAPFNVGLNGEGPWTPGLCSDNYTPCGTSSDCNGNTLLDRCDADCNANNVPDECDVDPTDPDGDGSVLADCNANGIPDVCDVDPSDPDGSGFVWNDCDLNGIPDACERFFSDCNKNGVDDFCDILTLEMNDANTNGIPDICESLGTSVVLDFEDVGSSAFDYTIGVVDQQPDESFVDDTFYYFNFHTVNSVDMVGIPASGVADVASGSLGAPGTKKLVLREITSNGTPQADYSVWSPHIFSADPSLRNVFGFPAATMSDPFAIPFTSLPLYQEISMMVKLNQVNDLGGDARPDTTLDWDLYFGSMFGGLADDGSAFFVNDFRVVVTFNTDTTTNSLPTEIQTFPAADSATFVSVDWKDYLGQEVELKVVIDLRNSPNIDNLLNTGHVYWDGVKIADFTPFPAANSNYTYLLDKFYVDQFRNTPEVGFGGATLEIDNVRLTHDRGFLSCSAFGTVDCDGNGICDIFESNRDRDGNGALDVCEGFCPDCNNNGIVDAAEIAAGSAPDMDANGVIDYCEKATHTQNFEAGDGFAVGDIEGQEGYHIIGSALYEISSTPAGGFSGTAFPRQGAQYLVIKDNPDANESFSLLYGPRQDAVGDADIELFTWDWSVSGIDFARYIVEIGDLCTDAQTNGVAGDGADFSPLEWIDTANAGLQLRGNNIGATPAGALWLLALQNETADHSYVQISGVANNGGSDNVRNLLLGDGWQPAGLRILNKRGEIQVIWNAGDVVTQDNIISDVFTGCTNNLGGNCVLQTFSETRRLKPGSTFVFDGGDRQVVIRTEDRPAMGSDPSVGAFGADGTTELYFDDFRYTTCVDCDADGTCDDSFLAAFPDYDKNTDGIPDNCQDCDNDCGIFPVADVACLDPAEAVGNDCNNNGVQDDCDVDPLLPFVTIIENQGCKIDYNSLPNGGCFVARYGGGSCDANTNGIPDECEGDDCDGDGCLDAAQIDIAGGSGGVGGALDVDSNGGLDSCQGDCNHNGIPDGPAATPGTDLSLGNTGSPGSQDAFPIRLLPFDVGDGIPDECCVVCDITLTNCSVVTPDGDLDRDGDVDAQDYQYVQRCASLIAGNPFPHPAGTVVGSAVGGTTFDGVMCGCADFDANGVVDSHDVGMLQNIVTGP